MTSTARHEADLLAALLRTEHHAMADFLVALLAFDRRRGWAQLGHATLWAFLHRELGLSAGAAHQRKVAVRLLERFASVEAALRAGQLCLSGVVELARVLTPENEAEVLPKFFRLSAREARELAAGISPRPIVPTRVVVTVVDPARQVVAGFHTYEAEKAGAGSGCVERPAGAGEPASTVLAAVPPLELTTPPPQRDRSEPLTADLHRLHVTVTRHFLDKLEAARAARSHARPGATMEVILEEALDLLLAREARRREARTDRPRARARVAAPDRITAEVRRQVWARDEGRCQWPLDGGGICGSTHQLELDHARPKARGGPPTAANLRILCHAHNAEAARRAFGPEWMRRFGKGTPRGAPRGPAGPPPGPVARPPVTASESRPAD